MHISWWNLLLLYIILCSSQCWSSRLRPLESWLLESCALCLKLGWKRTQPRPKGMRSWCDIVVYCHAQRSSLLHQRSSRVYGAYLFKYLFPNLGSFWSCIPRHIFQSISIHILSWTGVIKEIQYEMKSKSRGECLDEVLISSFLTSGCRRARCEVWRRYVDVIIYISWRIVKYPACGTYVLSSKAFGRMISEVEISYRGEHDWYVSRFLSRLDIILTLMTLL